MQTTLGYLDDQGEKWGDTYIKVVGQHYDDYAHWEDVQQYLPIGGGVTSPVDFIPQQFNRRRYKGAAHGVTGLIGEVLVTVWLQKVLRLAADEMAHLLDNRKAPDICLDIEPSVLSRLIRNGDCETDLVGGNQQIAQRLEAAFWPAPLPVECKSRRGNGNRAVGDALRQLVAYWREVPDMAGYGIFADVQVVPETHIVLHLLAPKDSEALNVRSMVTGQVAGTGLTSLPTTVNYKVFQQFVGGRLLG